MTMSTHTSRPTTTFLCRLIALVSLLIPSLCAADLIKLTTNTGFNSVYLLEIPEAPTVTVALTVLAGEVDVDGPEGLSHYLEHLVFSQADGIADQQIHARGGNAWVNGIITSYYNDSEKSDLEPMLTFVRKLFDPIALDAGFVLRERDVVAREYDLRVSENPERRILTALRQNLYNDLPVSRSTIGTLQSIGSLTIAQAAKFHKRFYHPANSVLFIAGNISKADATKAVENILSELPHGDHNPARWRQAQIEESADTVEVIQDEQVNFDRLLYLSLFEWPEKQSDIDNYYSLWILRNILDSALDGGIARPLRMDNFVLRSFELEVSSYLSNYVELTFYGEPDKGVELEQAATAITDTFKMVAESGIPAKTLQRVKTRLLQTQKRQRQNTESHYNRMSEQLSAGLSPVTYSQHIKNIEKVSLQDVNELLQALVSPKRRAVALITSDGE